MKQYSVQKLAKLAGVSVRTLHHYDRLGLLKPSVRTEAKYRLYGEKELLLLQQILFYKELDFPLGEIKRILSDPEFDLLEALTSHRQALIARKNRLTTLLETIDKTMSKVNGEQVMLTDDQLYAGFTKEQAQTYRQEAAAKYGEETVQQSETHLRKMSKAGFEQLKAEQQEIGAALYAMKHLDPTSVEVQQLIARHYANIRAFWGPSVSAEDQADAYKGLGQLYVDDPRYTQQDGQGQSEYALFLRQAMIHFADSRLVK